MTGIYWYFLKFILISGIFYGYYHLALRNKMFHIWNRFYLLFSVIASLLLPLVRIDLYSNDQSPILQTIQFISVGEPTVFEVASHGNFDVTKVLQILYIIISCVFIYGIISALWKIHKIKKISRRIKSEGIIFYHSLEDGTPFSFFNSIFWNDYIELDSNEGKRILKHELVHIKEHHTHDKVFLNIMLSLFWINPFFWLIRKELSMIHEFIADQQSVKNGNSDSLAQIILKTVYPQTTFSLTNPFFYSPIKRRLQMITKINKKANYATRLMALPVASLIFFSFSFKVIKNVEQYDSKILEIAGKPIQMENVAIVQNDKIPNSPEPATVMESVPKKKISLAKPKLYHGKNIEFVEGLFEDGHAIVHYTDGTTEKISNAEYNLQKFHLTPPKVKDLRQNSPHAGIEIEGKKVKSFVNDHTKNLVHIYFEDGTQKYMPSEEIWKSVNTSPIVYRVDLKEVKVDTGHNEVIFTKVEKEASFPGGDEAWIQFISKNIKENIDTLTKAGNYGTCIVKFIVDKNGNLSDVKPTTMGNTTFAKLVVDVIRKGPKWIPAEQNGKKVTSYRLQPVTLKEVK